MGKYLSIDETSLSQGELYTIVTNKEANGLRVIYNSTQDKGVAMTKLARWYNDVTDSDFDKFNTVTTTIYNHYQTILNYFDNRSTNASAESFNAKIKDFRRKIRGVADVKYFLFRLSKIYA